MATPRSESIKTSLSDHIGPVRSHHDGGGVDGMIDHYAYMGRVIHKGVEGFLTNDASRGLVLQAHSVKELDNVMTKALNFHLTSAWESSEFAEIAAHLKASQSERHGINPNIHPAVEWAMMAGVNTYMDTSSGLYGALQQVFGPEVACSPNNAAAIDRLSKLNISQFIPYKHTYLDAAADGLPLANIEHFIEQFDVTPDGDIRFKVGFPGNALIPMPAIFDKGVWGAADFLIEGNECMPLKHIPQSTVTIGCPISFDPQQGRQLWALYAEARQVVDRVGEDGTTTRGLGGSAVSAPSNS